MSTPHKRNRAAHASRNLPPSTLTIDQWATLYTEEARSPNTQVVGLVKVGPRGTKGGPPCPVIRRPSGRTYRISVDGRTRTVNHVPATWVDVR